MLKENNVLQQCNNQQCNRFRGLGMATQVPGADNQSTTEQAPGPESETSVARHVELNLNVPTPIPTYMLVQQLGAQSYSTYQHADYQQPQQGYLPSSVHGGRFYTAPQELHRGYQGYHLPLHEQMQGYSEQNYMQQVEGYVQSSQNPFETSRHQSQIHRVLPRRLPHMRQRVRRRIRSNRSNIHSVAANMVFNNREHSTATSITGSVTSGSVLQTPVEIEGSQERLSRLTSTAIDEASGIGENFECNICFQKANEAVVTCCGHLFCWPCLYRWLHVHSYHKECPVCKGSIAEYSVTPIYGRENALESARLQSALGSERIPPRPAARRVESARQQQQRERGEQQERTAPEQVPGTQIEQAPTEIEEGEPRAPGAADPSLESRGENNILQGEGTETAASRLQDMEHHVMNPLGEPNEHSQNNSGYLQRRLAIQREQLRQALVNSRYSAALNQIPGTGGERQQIVAASALLSQELEHIINSSRLVADPTQTTASMHARLANNVESSSEAATQQRSQMITSAISQSSQELDSDISSNRLVMQPSQVSSWITTMRTRLNNIEQLMHNLEHPHESIATPDERNPNSQLQLDDDDVDDLNSNEFLAELNATVAQPPNVVTSEQNPNPVAAWQPATESDPELRSSVPEAPVVRRSRSRREHGEEASHVVAAPEEGAEPAPHEDQLPLTRKRRRRLD